MKLSEITEKVDLDRAKERIIEALNLKIISNEDLAIAPKNKEHYDFCFKGRKNKNRKKQY
jgi:hypothetical protein